MLIIGFVGNFPIYETRAIVHDPSTGQFTSSGSGGSTGRNKLMGEHALKQSHPENAIKDMVHHLADKGSKVGKADASGKSPVHIDGEHVGHISSVSHEGAHIVKLGKLSSGKTAGHTVTTAHHPDGSTTSHTTKKDAIRALAENHHKDTIKHVEQAFAGKKAENASIGAHHKSKEANQGGELSHLMHQNAAADHGYAAYLHEKAGNHAKAAEHKALKAHHEAEYKKITGE